MQNFNELQRSAFCVYSGAGIHRLREYLESISPHLQDYSAGPPEIDDDNGPGLPPFGDPQLSDTDDEGDDKDMSSHFLLPHISLDNSTAIDTTAPRDRNPASGSSSSAPIDSRHSPAQSYASQLRGLHHISRSLATPGTSRQSRSSRNGESANTNTSSSRHTLPQVPEAYAGIGSSSQSGSINTADGSTTGIRHRSTNMSGSLPNAVVGALMHSRLQRSVAREEQRSQGVSGPAPNAHAIATGSDGRRGVPRWITGASGSVAVNASRSTDATTSRTNGSAIPMQTETPSTSNSSTPLPVSAITPSSSTSPSTEIKGAYDINGACITAESRKSDDEGLENVGKASRSQGGEETASEEAASCVHHENASGRSTPVRSAEGEEGASQSRSKGKDKGRSSPGQPSVTVALALNDLQPHDPSRTSTPSPSPSSKGVRKKIKGFNAAAASLFKGKERKS